MTSQTKDARAAANRPGVEEREADGASIAVAQKLGNNNVLQLTKFHGLAAAAKVELREMSWDAVCEALVSPVERATKESCPLLKLATFGGKKSKRGHLRNDENVLQVFGIEGDYDDGSVSPQEGARRLAQAGIEAFIYTTGRHTSLKPRWRVLAPLSAPCAPQQRRAYVKRLNAALGDILASESFSLSQAYYMGRVKGVEYETQRVPGTCLDLVNIAPPEPAQKASQAGVPAQTDPGSSAKLDALRLLLAAIPDNVLENYEKGWLPVGMALHLETNGSNEGLELWNERSATAPKYEGFKDLQTKWASFHRTGGEVATLRTLERLADQDSDVWRRYLTEQYFDDESDQAAAQPQPTHAWARFVDLARTPAAPEFILPGFIQAGVVVIAGAPGVGKTTALVPLAMIAAGLHRADDPLAPQHWRHVCYLTEDVDQVQRMVHAVVELEDWGVELATAAERLHVAPLQRLEAKAAVKAGGLFRAQFTRVVDGVGILPLVVVDTQAAALALDNENDNAEVSKVIAAFKQEFAGLPTWLVGHTAKAAWGQADAASLSSRGGGAWGADAHQQLFLVEEGGKRLLQRGKTRFEADWPALEIKGSTALLDTLDAFGQARQVQVRWGVPAPVGAPGQVDRDDASLRALMYALCALTEKGEHIPASEGRGSANTVLKANGYLKHETPARVHALLREAERRSLVSQTEIKTPQRKVKPVWLPTEQGMALVSGARFIPHTQ